jgi:hypothetical protein
MMKLPPHPNVVALIGVTPPPNFWIITEFLARGSLYTLLHSAETISERTQYAVIQVRVWCATCTCAHARARARVCVCIIGHCVWHVAFARAEHRAPRSRRA